MTRKMVATLVVVCLLMTCCPAMWDSDMTVTEAASETSVMYSKDGGFKLADTKDIPSIELVDNGDGTYMFVSDYVNEAFGTSGGSPSSMWDPIGTTVLGATPLETFSWLTDMVNIEDGFGDETLYYGHYPYGPSEPDKYLSYHTEVFPAALTFGQDFGGHIPSYYDGMESLDWSCALYYHDAEQSSHSDGPHYTPDGTLYLTAYSMPMDYKGSMLKGTDATISLDEVAGTEPYSVDELNRFYSPQAINLVNFAVGDFDDDPSEEIAIVHQYRLIIIDATFDICTDDEGHDWGQIDVSATSLGEIPIHSDEAWSPMCLTAVDSDGDGVDELLITNGVYSDDGPGHDEETIVTTCDFNGYGVSYDTMHLMVKDPKDQSRSLDSVMTSIVLGDVDADGEDEFVIGGYLWDNSDSDWDHTSDWGYSTGELYLSYAEVDEFLSPSYALKAVTILGDDNGTASTHNLKDVKSYKNLYKLNDHNVNDTSIYLTDEYDNALGLCRSPNWSNWTIPLATGCISGPSETTSDRPVFKDQVLFDRWFYQLNGDEFVVYMKTDSYFYKDEYVPTDNNIVNRQIAVGSISSEGRVEYDGTDTFVVAYFVEWTDDKDDVEWQGHQTAIVFENVDGTLQKTYGMKHGVYDTWSDFSEYTPRGMTDLDSDHIYTFGNFDMDTYYVIPIAHLYTYTDPTVIAVIDPIPYDADMADVLYNGSSTFGSSSFAEYSGITVEKSSTVSYSAGASSSLERAIIDFSVQGGYTGDTSWAESKSTTISTTYQSPDGTVALIVVPMDYFIYLTYEPLGDNYRMCVDYVSYTGDPIHTMMGFDEYEEFIAKYNAMMMAYDPNAVTIGDLGLDHSLTGDLDAYYYDDDTPRDLICELNGIVARGTDPMTTVSQSIDLSESSTDTVSNGGFLNLELMLGTIRTKGGINASINYSEQESTTNVSGMVFTNNSISGYSYLYLGDSRDAEYVVDQYYVTYSMWAEQCELQCGEITTEYVHIGYTVDHHTTVPDLGTVIVNAYRIGQDSPYDPTKDAIFMDVIVPSASGPDAGDVYRLQMKLGGTWYTMTELAYEGVQADLEGPDGSWISTDVEFVPTDGEMSYKVRVSGLSAFSADDFEFRVNAAIIRADGELHNPSLPVIGYKDYHSDAAPISVEGTLLSISNNHSGHHFSVNRELFDGIEKGSIILLKTGLTPGERVNIWTNMGDALLKKGLTTDSNGDILFRFDGISESSKDDQPLDAGLGLLVVATMVLIGTAVAFAYNRK